MNVYQVSVTIIVEASDPEEAVSLVLAHYNLEDYLDVTDITADVHARDPLFDD